MVKGTGVDDIMILNLEGDVVYTAYKGVDLGSNIKRGEFRGGGLEKVFDEAVHSNSLDFVALSDLELYQPSYNLPAGFVASPIADGNEIIGVYVAQLPIAGINTIMTGAAAEDVVAGLGETGETYLAGQDDLMRSNSREIIDDPKEYATRSGRPRNIARCRRPGPRRQEHRDAPTDQVEGARAGQGRQVRNAHHHRLPRSRGPRLLRTRRASTDSTGPSSPR